MKKYRVVKTDEGKETYATGVIDLFQAEKVLEYLGQYVRTVQYKIVEAEYLWNQALHMYGIT